MNRTRRCSKPAVVAATLTLTLGLGPAVTPAASAERRPDHRTHRGTGEGSGSSRHHDRHAGGFGGLAERRAEATRAQRRAADRLLAALERELVPFADETAARAAGFVPNPDPKSRLIHYRNVANRRDDRQLDPTHLEGLVYLRTRTGRLHLMGALFTVRPGEVAPTPGGPIFRWHTHNPGCGTFLVEPGACSETFRMLHVWTARGLPIADPWKQHLRDALDRDRIRTRGPA